jgi:hypothetical protein
MYHASRDSILRLRLGMTITFLPIFYSGLRQHIKTIEYLGVEHYCGN